MATYTDAEVDDLIAQSRPLQARGDPLKADMKAMVPPGAAALLAELENPAPAAQAAEDEEVATLDFVGDEPPVRTFRLKYPFTWEGVRHDAVTVRQLTTAEVGRLDAAWRQSGKAPLLMDVYGAMTGLPARVLRALPHADGEPVIRAAWDFLPRSYRDEDG